MFRVLMVVLLGCVAVASHANAEWLVDGNLVVDGPYYRHGMETTADGAGGAIVAWHVYNSLEADIFAQRIDQHGNGMWGPSPTVACTSDRDKPELLD